MIKETTLCLMILIDWISHIFEAISPTNYVFQIWASIVRSIGWNNFWITYWGLGLILASLILLERMEILK